MLQWMGRREIRTERTGEKMSDRIYGLLEIELRSDLCTGSGYSYAGIVDSDICYDDFGIPYIPARRMRGCLRDTWETILFPNDQAGAEAEAEVLFGKAGDKQPGDLALSNAYISEYKELRAFLKSGSKVEKKYFQPQAILERFTHVVGQTRMKEGIADPQSLRYTRVVNQLSPFAKDRENLVFEAEVSCSEGNWEKLEQAVRGTRHIGLKRNRGMGFVRCELKKQEASGKSDLLTPNENASENDAQTVIAYTLENNAPLILSNHDEASSETFISGRSILGCLAARYLSLPGNTAEDQAFQELFLSKETIFSNLYPSVKGTTFVPAPGYINKLKKTGKLVNLLAEDKKENTEADYRTENGNMPKKLKGKYVALNQTASGYDTASVYEVEKDIIYHHSRRKTGVTGKEGMLYLLEAVSPGQQFYGEIRVPAQYADLVRSLIQMGDIRLGKSKNTEYGTCTVLPCSEHKSSSAPFELKAGDEIVVTFVSDAILTAGTEENEHYAVTFGDLTEAVKKALNLDAEVIIDKSSFTTTVLAGYVSEWNLQRGTVPAVSAGSYVTLKLKEDLKEPVSQNPEIGGFVNEGYGQIRIDLLSAMKYVISEVDPDKISEEKEDKTGDKDPVGVDWNRIDRLVSPILLEAWMDELLVEKLGPGKKTISVSNSSAGRFILMLSESIAENREDPEKEIMELFEERIESIKGDAKKEGQKLIKDVNKTFGISETSKTEMDSEPVHVLRKLIEKTGKSSEKADIEVRSRQRAQWPKYVMTLLVNRKYEGRNKA